MGGCEGGEGQEGCACGLYGKEDQLRLGVECSGEDVTIKCRICMDYATAASHHGTLHHTDRVVAMLTFMYGFSMVSKDVCPPQLIWLAYWLLGKISAVNSISMASMFLNLPTV